MYRNSCQRGMLTVFYSVGSKPLGIWDTHIQDGYVTRFLDQDIKSMVLEIGGNNVSTTYITCPKDNKVLGITLPFLVMIVKNLKKYFTFEVTILDESGFRRRFRVSNFQSSTQILPFCTAMPIGLSDGWNQIQFNLAEFTRRAYNKQYVEVQNLKINANIRLRRIYFSERLLSEDELPAEYKLFFPISSNAPRGKKAIQATDPGKENINPSTSPHLNEQPIQSDKNHNIVKSSKTSIRSIKKHPSQESKQDSKIEEITTKETEETVKITDEQEIVPPSGVEDQTEGQEVLNDNATETNAMETRSISTTAEEKETAAVEVATAETATADPATEETATVETATAEPATEETATAEEVPVETDAVQ